MKVLGLVLAGGQSSRMGNDKAMLEIDGETMLARSQKLLRACEVAKVVVSRNDGELDSLADMIPNKGPLSGIHSALHHYLDYDLLIIPVDLPLLNAKSVKRLIALAQKEKLNTCFRSEQFAGATTKGVAAKTSKDNKSHEGMHFPIYLRNTPPVRDELSHVLVNTQKYSVFTFFKQFEHKTVRPLKPYELINVNSEAQWQQIVGFFK
ncbi:MAG: molybdenum cofactor guanylyltransferase [Glaciecola sp.]